MKTGIKCRVWNGHEMIYDVVIGRFGAFYVNPSNGGMDEKDSACLSPFNSKYPESVPVMLFNGLYDKKRKEIYSGDIIKGANGVLYKVEFINGSFCIDNFPICFDHTEGKRVFNTEDWAEVVGNIYENSDLINSL